MPRFPLSDLTSESFAPYGEVFPLGDVTLRADHVAVLQNERSHAKPNLFLARTSLAALPFDFTKMEQHPHSSQSFLPLGTSTMLIAAARPGPDGKPDLSTLKAFLARGTGFSYRAGTWHIPIASLEETTAVAGFMYEDGTSADCLWADIEMATLILA